MKKDILFILNDLPAGKQIKRSAMLSDLRSRGHMESDRAMRLEIEELIKEGACIASSEKGYELIRTREQLEKAKAYLRSKAEAIAVRANYLEKNFREAMPPKPIQQLDLLDPQRPALLSEGQTPSGEYTYT